MNTTRKYQNIDWDTDDPTVTCTIAEAAYHVGVGASSVSRAMDAGYLRYVRLNGAEGRRRLRVVDVREWVAGS